MLMQKIINFDADYLPIYKWDSPFYICYSRWKPIIFLQTVNKKVAW